MSKYNSQYTGPEIDAGIRPYKVYTALLTQVDLTIEATIIENTLGFTPIWVRDMLSTGVFTADFSSITGTIVAPNYHYWATYNPNPPYVYHWAVSFGVTDSIITMITRDSISLSGADGVLYDYLVEIRVYP